MQAKPRFEAQSGRRAGGWQSWQAKGLTVERSHAVQVLYEENGTVQFHVLQIALQEGNDVVAGGELER